MRDVSGHICLVLFLVCLGTYGTQNDRKVFLNYLISEFFNAFVSFSSFTLLFFTNIDYDQYKYVHNLVPYTLIWYMLSYS